MINFKNISTDEIACFMKDLGQPAYRTKQVVEWIYGKMATTFDEMTDLPLDLRSKLDELGYISNLKILKIQRSKDGTRKFLFELEDGESIESVLIPNVTGSQHFTLCVSSQVGCAMDCRFCTTGAMGFRRNLMNHEISDQIIVIKRFLMQESAVTRAKDGNNQQNESISNLVFMGMGEPLNNFNELITALWKLTGLMGFSKRRITVSTAGIVPRMGRLASEGPGVNLAVSLNATSDEVRSYIMPVNERYPIKALIDACRRYPLPPRRRITFEYVLLEKINDTVADAKRLVRLLRGIPSKVNLIPYNPSTDVSTRDRPGFRSPCEKRINDFQRVLRDSNMTAIIRKSYGFDIEAACGQLRAISLV